MYYRQPRYFSGFHCIGGDCPDNCCYGWIIIFTEAEVDKLQSAENAPSELKELIERTFVFDKNLKKYLVKFDERGKCPLLTEDGFCRIQREIGVEYMSHTCMVYPRHYILTDNCCYRYCNMSCREVMRSLLNDEKSMDMVNVPVREKTQIKGVLRNTPESFEKHPELKYREELLEFFYEVIADKKRSLEDSMILGALAAQSLTKLVESKEYDRIPEALKAFRKQFHNPEALKNIANITPNYNTKLGVLAEFWKKITPKSNFPVFTDNTGKLNIDLYRQGERRLEETYKDRPFAFRNIALNLLLELAVPFKFEDKTIFENYSLFITSYALFKLNAIDISENTRRAESGKVHTEVVGLVKNINLNISIKFNNDSYVCQSSAKISRKLCHNNDNGKKLIDCLKAYKMTSPAYLALLVK